MQAALTTRGALPSKGAQKNKREEEEKGGSGARSEMNPKRC